MERYTYVKVLLYAYPKLDALAEAVAGGAEVKALLSFRMPADACRLAEKIAEEVVSAKRLSCLKSELEELWEGFSEEELFLLEYKYFRRKGELSGRFAGRTLPFSERSYFRMQNALLQKVAARLIARGWTERRFFAEFGGFAPFVRVYRALKEGRERAVVFKRRRRELVFGQNSETS